VRRARWVILISIVVLASLRCAGGGGLCDKCSTKSDCQGFDCAMFDDGQGRCISPDEGFAGGPPACPPHRVTSAVPF
jgi:hypothetical protein